MFIELVLADDSVTASGVEVLVNVLENDQANEGLEISSFTQPSVGSVALQDGQLLVTLPRSFAGSTTFTYSAVDVSGEPKTASVEVFSVNALTPAAELVDPTEAAEEIVTPTAVFETVSSLFDGIVSFELSTLQFSFVTVAPLLVGGLWFAFRQRAQLLSVTTLESGQTIAVERLRGGERLVGHQALVWGTRRSRTRGGQKQVLVETDSNTRMWVPVTRLTDTGY